MEPLVDTSASGASRHSLRAKLIPAGRCPGLACCALLGILTTAILTRSFAWLQMRETLTKTLQALPETSRAAELPGGLPLNRY